MSIFRRLRAWKRAGVVVVAVLVGAVACGIDSSPGDDRIAECDAYIDLLHRCTGADDAFFALSHANFLTARPKPAGLDDRERMRAACVRDTERLQRACR